MISALRWGFLVILLLTLNACSEQEVAKFDLPETADKMIAGDSTKTWMLASRYNDGNRMNMGDCFIRYRISYKANKSFSDNNGESSSCGPTLEGKWYSFQNDNGSFIKWESAQLPELLNIEEEFKYFKLVNLNNDSLVVSYTHRQYGNKLRTIVDYLVPEGTSLPDRYFHNQ